MGLVDDRAAVGGHVNDAAPAAQDLRLADHRHQGHPRFHHMFQHRQIAARGITCVKIQIAAKHQTTLVGLADVEMPHAKADHTVDNGLQPFGDKGLKDVAFDRQAHPGHRRHLAGSACGDHRHFLGADRAARRLHAPHPAIFDVDPGDFAVLNQIDPARICPARISPGHRIMTRGSGAALVQAAVDRKAGLFVIKIGEHALQLIARQKFGVIPLIGNRIAPAHRRVALTIRMEQHDLATLPLPR